MSDKTGETGQALWLETAFSLGARLCRDAIWAGDRCNWLGDSMEYLDGAWVVAHRAANVTMYDGTSGIALFLARLYKSTGESLFRETALGALRQALSRADEVTPMHRLGAYSGWTGLAYCAYHAGEALCDDGAASGALTLLRTLPDIDFGREALDVIAGAAGAITLLLDLRARLAEGWMHDFAVRQGERLLETAVQGPKGLSWFSMPTSSGQNLTGLSHGSAGIAWALLELWNATGDSRFRRAAEGGFAYERGHYQPDQENWPDLRGELAAGAAPPCAVAWCHGAPGIGLSRLRAHQLTGEATYRAECEIALRTTREALRRQLDYPIIDFSLCHGGAGNAELLLMAAGEYGAAGDETLVLSLAQRAIEQSAGMRAPWPCGVPAGGEAPGLMLGLAGIGYFYLRLADRDSTPSILLPTVDQSRREDAGASATDRDLMEIGS